MNDSLILRAVKESIYKRNPSSKVIFHSDRGSQYFSKNLKNFLNKHNLISSMNVKGKCWDNAIVESFFVTLKKENEYFVYVDNNDTSLSLLNYIEMFYNSNRQHSYLGYMSPMEFKVKNNPCSLET